MKSFDGKNVLITGGSSGIGLAIAKNLASRGANIWLLARDPKKLDAACSEVSQCAKKPGQKVDMLQADVADEKGVAGILAQYINRSGTPDLLVNSAGITHPGIFHELDISTHRSNMEINYFGTLHTTMAVVPGMVDRKSGHILNISSLVGIHGLYGYSAYSPSKFAVRGLSDVLRYELQPYGITISVAFPSDTLTPQLDYENKHKPPILKALSESNTTPVPPEGVAEKIIKAVQKNRYLILPTMDALSWYIVYELLPGEAMYWMVDLLMKQARRKAAKHFTAQENKAYPD